MNVGHENKTMVKPVITAEWESPHETRCTGSARMQKWLDGAPSPYSLFPKQYTCVSVMSSIRDKGHTRVANKF